MAVEDGNLASAGLSFTSALASGLNTQGGAEPATPPAAYTETTFQQALASGSSSPSASGSSPGSYGPNGFQHNGLTGDPSTDPRGDAGFVGATLGCIGGASFGGRSGGGWGAALGCAVGGAIGFQAGLHEYDQDQRISDLENQQCAIGNNDSAADPDSASGCGESEGGGDGPGGGNNECS